MRRLGGLPPLVLAAECDQLKERLASVHPPSLTTHNPTGILSRRYETLREPAGERQRSRSVATPREGPHIEPPFGSAIPAPR